MNTDNLIEFRKDLKITQTEMAKLIGIKQPTYSEYENGGVIIPLEHLNVISNKYNKSLDFLAGLTRNNNPKFNHIKLDKKEIGKRLRKTRIENKLTQEEIAKKLNTVHSCISDYETGKTMIPTIFMIGYAKISNTSIDYLCGKISK